MQSRLIRVFAVAAVVLACVAVGTAQERKREFFSAGNLLAANICSCPVLVGNCVCRFVYE